MECAAGHADAGPPVDTRNTDRTKRRNYDPRLYFWATFAPAVSFASDIAGPRSPGDGMWDQIIGRANAGLQGYVPCDPARRHVVESFAYAAIMERYAYLGEGDSCLILTDGYEIKEISNAK
jgi:hypothetical protein